MEINGLKRGALLSLCVAAFSLAAAGGALAQGQYPPPPQGQFMQGGPGPRGGFGMPMMRPMAGGTVQSVDTTNRTITLTDQNGNTQTLSVPSGTKIVGARTISASDLKVGDQIQVRGVPQVISADSIMSGDLSSMPQAGPVFGAAMGQGPGRPVAQEGGDQSGGQGYGPPPGPGPMAGPQGQAGNASGTAVERGTIESTSPLTISLGNGQMVTVKTRSATKVRTVGQENLSDIQKGDEINAQINRASDGTITAVQVNVNMPMPFPGLMAGRPRFGGQQGMGMGPGPNGPGQGFGPPPAGLMPPPPDGSMGAPPPSDGSDAPPPPNN